MSNSTESSLAYKIFPVLLVFALYTTSFGLLIPAFPALLNQYTFNNVESSSMIFGVANLLKHGLEFFSTPILGTLSDIYGRKPILLFAMFIVSIESFMIALYPSLNTMILSKILAGFGDANFSITYIIMTDILTLHGENLTRGYGYVSATFGVGFIIGPLLGLFCIYHYSFYI